VVSGFQFVDSGVGDIKSDVPVGSKADTFPLVEGIKCRDESVVNDKSDSSNMLP